MSLRKGFIIECEWHIKDGVKHSEYKLNKVHIEQDRKSLYAKAFDKMMGVF